MKQHAPTFFVIFGATGDLSRRKLIPALFDLYERNLLPQPFSIIGFARTEYTDKTFRALVRESIAAKRHGHSEDTIFAFLKNIYYTAGSVDRKEDYVRLSEAIVEKEKKHKICGNKLFYLAVSSRLYSTVFENLANSGLGVSCGESSGWTRILVEKPFGSDLETAISLDKKLARLFQENQIFRIDHYMAKEAVQNLLAFRFSNTLFEPVWNKKYIERVEIRFTESIGIEGRGAFYDKIGALRDVGQNHMLQMLAFIAMEYPGQWEPEAIRAERAKVLEKLVVPKNLQQAVVRAQYDGYRREDSVSRKSNTETYFKVEAFLKSGRLSGVPFVLESGKALKEKSTEVSVIFREAPCLCFPRHQHPHKNKLTFRIEPTQGIEIVFWRKQPGFAVEVEPKELSFSYPEGTVLKLAGAKGMKVVDRLPDAYERILYDCIYGDQMLFASTREVRAAWKFTTPILKRWEEFPLLRYRKGSAGVE